MPSPSVIVLGGGIGGLSAAHELIERGCAVTVLEQRIVPGGKARSLHVPGTAQPPQLPLPGEHGFRFFPHFYRHIIDTMARTPVGGGKTAADQLVYASKEMLARFGHPPIQFPAHVPTTWAELEQMIRQLLTPEDTGLTDDDYAFFAERLWRLMTACHDRQMAEFENQSWWSFMEADQRSAAFRHFFVEGVTRCLVAAKATVANVRAGGLVLTQLVYGSMSASPSFDRVLDGPTTEVWIHPWRDYLMSRGVVFEYSQTVSAIVCDGQRITGVQSVPAPPIPMPDSAAARATVLDADAVPGPVPGAAPDLSRARTWQADWYVCALPVEYTAPLLNAQVLAADPSLAGILKIAGSVYDMTGIQFYLAQDVPLVNGHLSMIDTPWALTGISQRQFWSGVDFQRFGDGKLGGILSIDISEWDEPGMCFPGGPNGQNLTARQCTAEQVATDVWTQARKSLVQADGSSLLPEARPPFFIDPGMVFAPTPVSNNSRLFVNEVHSWEYRPEAGTAIPNLVLASDYVRTWTNLATMEAANEAARRAVNALIERAGLPGGPCQLWPLYVPEVLTPFIDFDWVLWKLGRAWQGTAG